MSVTECRLPLSAESIQSLRAGERVTLSGKVYVARDAAHARMVRAAKEGADLPFDVENSTIYYMGPSPARPGRPIGSAGPTTSGRMDPYTPFLLSRGLAAMIGKGPRSSEVIEAIRENQRVYFVACGGAGALLASRIRESRIVAYEDLGPEAIRELTLEQFPCWVGIDSRGESVFDKGSDA